MTIKKIVILSSLSVCLFSAKAMANHSKDTLVVTANLFPQPVSTVLAPVNVVTRDEIEQWQAKSVVDVIRRLPGINIAQNGGRGQATAIYTRGTNDGQTLILVNGVRMATASVTGNSNINQIPLSIVQRIEYIRGSRSSVYGSEAIGGVINIITYSEDQNSGLALGVGSKGYQYYSGNVYKQLSDATKVTLGGSFEQAEGFNVYPTSQVPADADDDGFRSKTLFAEVEHQFSESFSGFLRGYGYGNHVDYDQVYAQSTDERNFYSRNYDGGLRFQQGDYASQLTLSYQQSNDYNFGDVKAISTAQTISQRSLQWGNIYSFEQASVSAGLDWRDERLQPKNQNSGQEKSRDNVGLYLTSQKQFGPFIAEAALRTDDNQQFGRHNTWQGGLGWDFMTDYRLIVSYGTAFKAPTFSQLYGGDWGNANLHPEESVQWEVGLEKTGQLNWRLSAYRNKIENMIDYDFASKKYLNTGEALIKGVEWEMDFVTGPLSHNINIDWKKPTDERTGKDLLRRSRETLKYQLDWRWFNMDMDIAYQYNGKRYDLGYARLPSYSTIDLAASYPVSDNFTIRAKIANLFDKDYETAKGYATAGREFYFTGSYQF